MTLATCTPGWSWVAWCHCHGHLELQFEKWEHKLFSSWEQGMEVGVFAEKGGRVLSSLGEQWVGNWLSVGRGKVLDQDPGLAAGLTPVCRVSWQSYLPFKPNLCHLTTGGIGVDAGRRAPRRPRKDHMSCVLRFCPARSWCGLHLVKTHMCSSSLCPSSPWPPSFSTMT